MHLIKQVYMFCTLHLHRVTWLSLSSVIGIYFVVSWLGLSFFKETVLTRPAEFFWYMQVTMSTVGYGDVSPSSDGGKLFAALFIIPVGIALFGAIIGKSINSTRIVIERNMNGMSNFSSHSGHVIVVGWHGHTGTMIDCILSDSRRQNGRILLCVKSDDMTHPMADNSQVDFARVRCFSDPIEMKRIGLSTANRVIIHGDSDEQTLTTALAFSPAVNDSAHIVAYFEDSTSATLLDRHCKNVECGTQRSAEMLARSMQDPGSSRVMNNLLNPQKGATQYAIKVPENTPSTTVAKLSQSLRDDHNALLLATATMLSGDDAKLVPDPSTPIEPGMYIHYIAEKRLFPVEIQW